MVVTPIETKEAWEKEMKGPKPIIVDFFAEWCGPCKMISPKLEELSNTCTNLVFLKIDVDNADLQDIVENAGISAMPTFQVYKDGDKVEEIVGADYNKLQAMVEKFSA